MNWKNIKFEKHPGMMDMDTKNVVFYKLVFDNIINAGKVLRDLPPGNYEGWVNGVEFGVIDLDTGESHKYIA